MPGNASRNMLMQPFSFKFVLFFSDSFGSLWSRDGEWFLAPVCNVRDHNKAAMNRATAGMCLSVSVNLYICCHRLSHNSWDYIFHYLFSWEGSFSFPRLEKVSFLSTCQNGPTEDSCLIMRGTHNLLCCYILWGHACTFIMTVYDPPSSSQAAAPQNATESSLILSSQISQHFGIFEIFWFYCGSPGMLQCTVRRLQA